MLERHEIEAFLTLAEELHFGRTAERLHVSTARVSQTIKKLERRVGVPLFHRTSRRVELSAVGAQLAEDLRPGWARIEAGFQRALDAGRGLTGTLRAGFVHAAGGQLLMGAAEQFHRRHPDCAVEIRETQLGEALAWLREGEVEVLLAQLPVHEPDIAMGPVLVTEARMLAVPAGHRLAGQESVSTEDLSRVNVLQAAGATFQEILTRVGAGQGAFPVGAQTRRYSMRPDVAYVPFRDAPPVEWGLIWLKDAATARIRAFAEATHEQVRGAA